MRNHIFVAAASALAVSAAWAVFPSSVEATVQSGGGETYAAIATRYTGSIPYRGGTASNARSREEAAQRAVAACGGGPDCVLVLEFSGRGCGIYMASNDGSDYAWGWAMENSRADAERGALAECQSQLHAGESCINRTQVCNSRGGTSRVIYGKRNESAEDDEDDWY